MRVLVDTNALIYLLDKRSPRNIQDRLKGLVEDIDKTRGQLIIPTMVVTEYLVGAGSAGKALLDALMSSRFVLVAPFDHVAAEECASMQATANATGNKRHPLGRNTAWQKVKVDRQILAIAKVRNASVIADDEDVFKLAKDWGIPVATTSELPLPEWAKQLHLVGVPPPSINPTTTFRPIKA